MQDIKWSCNIYQYRLVWPQGENALTSNLRDPQYCLFDAVVPSRKAQDLLDFNHIAGLMHHQFNYEKSSGNENVLVSAVCLTSCWFDKLTTFSLCFLLSLKCEVVNVQPWELLLGNKNGASSVEHCRQAVVWTNCSPPRNMRNRRRQSWKYALHLLKLVLCRHRTSLLQSVICAILLV